MIPSAIKELKELDHWVAWTRDKIPISPRGMPASSTDPETWGSCDDAKFIRRVQGLPGVGFVVTEEDPYVCIDLDRAVDIETEEVKPWAKSIMDRFNSYTEYSPGGFGIHIWIRGTIPRSGARTDYGIEVYKSRRFMTVTGKRVCEYPETIEDRSDVLLSWYRDVFEQEEQIRSERKITYEGDWDDVEEWLSDAMTYIDSGCSYHQWIRIALSIKGQLGDQGFHFWNAWSQTSDKYPGYEDAWAKWRKLEPSGEVGIATVVWLAERGGFELAKHRHRLPPGFESGWDALFEDAANDPLAFGLELEVVDLVDAYLDTSPFEEDLISPGVLGPGDLCLLFGPPKSMKSMLCLDIFRQMAMGRPWMELEPARPLNIFYMQFENKFDQMRQRIQMAPLNREEIELLRGRFHFTHRFTPRLNASFIHNCAERILTLYEDDLDVLIIDPMANIFNAESENDNAQMIKFLAEIKILRNAINPRCAIVLVHHSGKMGRDDRQAEPFNAFRGASALRGSYDSGIYLDTISNDRRKLWFELRNGPALPNRVLEFRDGRFVNSERSSSGSHVEEMSFDPVLETILDEAASGIYYTPTSFAQRFSGEVGGSEGTLRKQLSQYAAKDIIRFHNGDDLAGYEEVHHRALGYICLREMSLTPNRRKHASDGRLIPCSGWSH